MTGLANSANFVAFYDKDGFQARVAGNWRDEYLDHFGQAQNNSAFGTEPTFVNASTQIDFSTSYDINKQINVYLRGAEPERRDLQHPRPLQRPAAGHACDYGRRFTIGVHFKY